jgi:heptosyltransferase-1
MLFMPRILLVKTSSMGDIIHNMPLIHDIRTHYPDAIIDWVVEESFAEIARLNPLVNEIIPIAMRRWKRALFSKKTWAEFFAFKRKLQAHTYDAILDTQGLLKSAMICYWAKGNAHGANRHTAREAIAGYLYQHGHDIPSRLHASVRNRMVGAAGMGYPMPDTAPVYNLQLSETALPDGIPADYVIGLHGTARDAKLWPVEYWVAFGQYLSAQNLSLLLPWGNAEEHQRAQAIASQVPLAVVLPKMSLTQLATLLFNAKAAAGVDTGLMHMAVALKIPTLAIFTDTHIWQAGAYPGADSKAITIGGKHELPSADEAIQAIQQLLTPT